MKTKIKVGDTVFYPDDFFITGELIKAKIVKIIAKDEIAHVKRIGSKKIEIVWLENLKPYSKQAVNELKFLMEKVTKP